MKCKVFSTETLLLEIPCASTPCGYLYLGFYYAFVLLMTWLTCSTSGNIIWTGLEILLWKNVFQVLCESSGLGPVNNGLERHHGVLRREMD